MPPDPHSHPSTTTSPNAIQAGAIMMMGLFLYDIFWVFGSKPVFGSNVMVTVAKNVVSLGRWRLVCVSAGAASHHIASHRRPRDFDGGRRTRPSLRSSPRTIGRRKDRLNPRRPPRVLPLRTPPSCSSFPAQ